MPQLAGKEAIERKGGSRDYHLRRRYGITAADYDRMLASLGGLCVLCKQRPAEHVDHCHLTLAVRGLLCSCCNQGLGNLRDSDHLMRLAADYILRAQTTNVIGGDLGEWTVGA